MNPHPSSEFLIGQCCNHAAEALSAYESAATLTDDDTRVGDLLASLAHWCDANGQDFTEHLRAAYGSYMEETDYNGTQFPAVMDML